MPEVWYLTAIQEIEASSRPLRPWESDFLNGSCGQPGIKKRVKVGLSLTQRQESCLLQIHKRLTALAPVSGERR